MIIHQLSLQKPIDFHWFKNVLLQLFSLNLCLFFLILLNGAIEITIESFLYHIVVRWMDLCNHPYAILYILFCPLQNSAVWFESQWLLNICLVFFYFSASILSNWVAYKMKNVYFEFKIFCRRQVLLVPHATIGFILQTKRFMRYSANFLFQTIHLTSFKSVQFAKHQLYCKKQMFCWSLIWICAFSNKGFGKENLLSQFCNWKNYIKIQSDNPNQLFMPLVTKPWKHFHKTNSPNKKFTEKFCIFVGGRISRKLSQNFPVYAEYRNTWLLARFCVNA